MLKMTLLCLTDSFQAPRLEGMPVGPQTRERIDCICVDQKVEIVSFEADPLEDLEWQARDVIFSVYKKQRTWAKTVFLGA